MKIALLLPSYRRFGALFRTLRRTPLDPSTRFVVVANYPTWQLGILTRLFGDRADIIDERPYGKLGGAKAYNVAYKAACERGAEYVAHWADDILPFDKDWLDQVQQLFVKPQLDFGIFSSDEGNHKHRYGWNLFGGYPCAHFFIAKCAVLGDTYFDPRFKQYVADNEISIRLIRRGVKIALLPVMLVHDPCMKHRGMFAANYAADVATFNALYPDLGGLLDGAVLRGDYTNMTCISHLNKVRYSSDTDLPLISREELMNEPPVMKPWLYKLRWELCI